MPLPAQTCHALNLTQAALAALLNCSERAVHEWCRGRNPVPGPVKLACELMLEHGASLTERIYEARAAHPDRRGRPRSDA